mmetsp:Transcript_31211/g.61780  ORF Transcript_31211/g.61780 Transcript_31211/m.61780 type:complete len:255 (+) Transcript_31211:117-881(+)
MFSTRLLLFALPWVTLSSSKTITTTTSLSGRILYPDKKILALGGNFTDAGVSLISPRVVLDDGSAFATLVRPDGSFRIHSVPVPGVYLIDVHYPVYTFSQVKIQLSLNDDNKIIRKCIEYIYLGGPKAPVECDNSITITAIGENQYFEGVRGFSIFGMLKSPMVLMMIFSAGMMFLLPKMMENMEPEDREMMQKQMAMQSDPTKMISNLWGELTGGADDGVPQPKDGVPQPKETENSGSAGTPSSSKIRSKKRR